MIGWLSGRVIDRDYPGMVVLDVNGVGYDVETSLPTFFKLELETGLVQLYIHTIVREDAFLLYGFLEKQERLLFRALIKVNGVGPKMAIAILSHSTPQEFINCIRQKNTLLLTKLPGVGKKTAERLVVEMGDRLAQWPEEVSTTIVPKTINQQDEAISALLSLGYKRQEAIKALDKIQDPHATSEQLIRFALQQLALA